MLSDDDEEQTRAVRYFGLIEVQVIQFNKKGIPFYSSGYDRNLDICVADNGGRAVVVVNQAGNLRFVYTGYLSKGTFYQVEIATDSQCQIMAADFDNSCIHILNKDGHFLRYISNCDINCPWGIYVSTKDHLFVAEYM